jgi:hypothetical protein
LGSFALFCLSVMQLFWIWYAKRSWSATSRPSCSCPTRNCTDVTLRPPSTSCSWPTTCEFLSSPGMPTTPD